MKKKSGLFKKRASEKKVKKKMVLNKRKKMKRKKKEKRNRKEEEVQFELYCEKLVELMLFKKKICAPLVFRNYFVPYISFLHS